MLGELIAATATAELPELLERVEEHVRRSLDAFATGIYCFDDGWTPWAWRLGGLPGEFFGAYEVAGRAADPVHDRVVLELAASCDSRVLAPDEWRRSHLYRRVAAPFGLEHILQAPVVSDDGRIVASVHAARGPGERPFDAEDLLVAITLCAWLGTALPTARVASSGGKSVAVTRRQWEVARLVADGGTNARIARRLGVTEHAVKQVLKRLYARTGIASRTELATRFATGGLRCADLGVDAVTHQPTRSCPGGNTISSAG